MRLGFGSGLGLGLGLGFGLGLVFGFGFGGRAAAIGGREERGVVARDGVCAAEQRGASLLG